MNNIPLEELEKKIGFPPYGNEDGDLLADRLQDDKLPYLTEWVERRYEIPRKLTEDTKKPRYSSKNVLCKAYASPSYANVIRKNLGIVESESTLDSESGSSKPKPKRSELEKLYARRHMIAIKKKVGIMYGYKLDKEEREEIAKLLEALAVYMRD